ncbi:hypothetical protein [Deinococcus yavapaiensis]|uniref:Uncharacterized protein n=1 Tax=Deinococcus yavapaiensis KR-236 TaxID=694435 RepID=A0A318S7A8_9DEIO|nr:hypothetical protein [Deinococcus yavapaiensis]PYE53766.1 hypothetical protein DES52_10724 [Deinococcus yavapaiensis KR-236]
MTRQEQLQAVIHELRLALPDLQRALVQSTHALPGALLGAATETIDRRGDRDVTRSSDGDTTT